MEELIVRVLRTVACVPRLRIVARLAAGDELTLTRLAQDLRLRRDLVCTHLARLSSVGLVKRRRSGRRCCCAAGSPYGPGTLSGQVASWLGAALSSQSASPRTVRALEQRRRPTVHGEDAAARTATGDRAELLDGGEVAGSAGGGLGVSVGILACLLWSLLFLPALIGHRTEEAMANAE